jgi:hypothetical protein
MFFWKAFVQFGIRLWLYGREKGTLKNRGMAKNVREPLPTGWAVHWSSSRAWSPWRAMSLQWQTCSSCTSVEIVGNPPSKACLVLCWAAVDRKCLPEAILLWTALKLWVAGWCWVLCFAGSKPWRSCHHSGTSAGAAIPTALKREALCLSSRLCRGCPHHRKQGLDQPPLLRSPPPDDLSVLTTAKATHCATW